jgi:hypothetical protein
MQTLQYSQDPRNYEKLRDNQYGSLPFLLLVLSPKLRAGNAAQS